MTTYLANAFSPSMLPKLPSDVEFLQVDIKEFCQAVNRLDVNAIFALILILFTFKSESHKLFTRSVVP